MLDPDLPASPYQLYKNEGFKSWGEFVGTGKVSDNEKSKNMVKFDDFVKIVRGMNLKFGKEYFKIPLRKRGTFNSSKSPSSL